VTGLLFNSLLCLVIAGDSAEVTPQSGGAAKQSGHPAKQFPLAEPNAAEPNAARREGFSFVKPNKDPLVIEPGRSRLLHFPAGVRRTASSNADVGDFVQVGPQDVLVLARNRGVTHFTVWPSAPSAVPAVIVVRVERKLRLEE